MNRAHSVFGRPLSELFTMKTLAALRLLIGIGIVTLSSAAVAEDAYYDVPLGSLQLTEGKLPIVSSPPGTPFEFTFTMHSYAVLDGPGEAYTHDLSIIPWLDEGRDRGDRPRLVVRAPRGSDVTGRLFVPQTNLSSMVELKFRIPASAAKPEAKKSFYTEKASYYRQLQQRNIPGSAWFRHQAKEAARLSGVTNIEPTPDMMVTRHRPSEVEDAYDLFTGGRALSENLQLDRALPGTKPAD